MFKKGLLVPFGLSLILSGCVNQPSIPEPWHKAGFNGKEVQEGIATWEEWKKVGFTANEADKWKEYAFSLKEAKEWRDGGFSNALDAKRWSGAAGSVELAKKCKKAGFKSNDDELLYRSWIASGATKEEIKKWAKDFDTYNEYMDVKESDIPLQKYVEYKKAGSNLDLQHLKELIKNNIDIDRYLNIKKIISDNDKKVLVWSKTNYSLEEIEKFKNLPAYIVSNEKGLQNVLNECPSGVHGMEYDLPYIENIHNLSEKEAEDLQVKLAQLELAFNYMIANGYPTHFEHLSDITPFAGKGKCFYYTGEVKKIYDKKTIALKEYIGCGSRTQLVDLPYGYCDDYKQKFGRISILKFAKKIPDNLAINKVYHGVIKSKGGVKKFIFGNGSQYTDSLTSIIKE